MANPTNMDSGVDFQTWNNNERGGGSDSYTGTQGIDSRDANDDSLQTSDGTWVIVFDQSNYTGNCWQIDEGQYCENLHNNKIYDSSGNDTGNHWQGAINSFILYKQKPSWFIANSSVVPSNKDLFTLGNGEVLFTEDTYFLGDNRTFTAPYTGGNTGVIGYTTNGHNMSGAYAINSLSVGSNAWLIIFDDKFANGNFLTVPPNTPYNNLENIPRGTNNWKDQINSFLIYTSEPEFWNTPYSRPYVDFPTLFNLYPYPTNDVSDSKVVYMVEDSTYTIDCPQLDEQSAAQSIPNDSKINDTSNLPTSGWTKYHVYMQHDNNLFVKDDTAEFDLYFDNAGNLVQIGNFIWTFQSAEQIPQSVIKSVDLIVWYLGTAGALETMGISEEAADTFVDIFNFVCNAFDKIANAVYKFTDNGGEFYFLPVICHTLNRICATVAAPYPTILYTQSGDQRNNFSMAFKIANFPEMLTGTIGNSSVRGWETKQGSTSNSPYNQVVEYNYGGFDYRTWYQESSISGEFGMFVSCKIDYEISSDGVTDDSKDDHIILLMGFSIPQDSSPTSTDTTPMIVFAQAIVQFTDTSNANIITPAYNSFNSKTGTSNPYYTPDVISAVSDYINSLLASVTMDNNQQGRKYIGDVTKNNMIAISQCAYFGKFLV